MYGSRTGARRIGRAVSGQGARRALLAWGIVAGVALLWYFATVADRVPVAWDFRAYYVAANAALDGRPFVGVGPEIRGVQYVYPPPAVTLFFPLAVVGSWQAAFLLQTVVTATACGAVGVLVVRTVVAEGVDLDPVDRALVVGFCVASAPVVAVLGLGQVDPLGMLAVAVVFLAVEADRQLVAGSVLGGLALLKVFPAAFGLWLVYRRAWRAIGAAVATGVTGLLGGAALFGVDVYWRYLSVLTARSRLDRFAGTVSPNFAAMSLYRPLSQLFPALDPAWYGPIAVSLVAPFVWVVLGSGETLSDRLESYLVVLAAVLVVSPASNTLYVVYLYFPVLCLLFLDGEGDRPRPFLVVGTAAMVAPVQPAQVGAVLAAAGASPAVRSSVMAAVRPALSVASVALVGVVLVAFGCVVQSAYRRVRPVRAPGSVGTD